MTEAFIRELKAAHQNHVANNRVHSDEATLSDYITFDDIMRELDRAATYSSKSVTRALIQSLKRHP